MLSNELLKYSIDYFYSKVYYVNDCRFIAQDNESHDNKVKAVVDATSFRPTNEIFIFKKHDNWLINKSSIATADKRALTLAKNNKWIVAGPAYENEEMMVFNNIFDVFEYYEKHLK